MANTGTIQPKNKTLRKYFENEGIFLTLLNADAAALTEGQEVFIFGNNSVKKRVLGTTYPIGHVTVGDALAAATDNVTVKINGSATLQAKAIGGTLAAAAFVKPNGNTSAEGLPEYVAAASGDYAGAIVISGGAQNAEIRLILLYAPVLIP